NVDRILRDRDKLVNEAKKLRIKPGGKKKTAKGKDPLWKKFEGNAQKLSGKVIDKLREMNIGNQIIDREDGDPLRRGLVQRLRSLVEDIERAERVIELWTNGNGKAREERQNLLYVSFGDQGGNGAGQSDLHLKAA